MKNNKEKRILALEVNPDCKALYVDYGDQLDPDGGMFCDKNGRYVRITEKDCAKCKRPVLAGITRAEAIERMAKGLCSWEQDCIICECGVNTNACRLILSDEGYIARAEAALDALLGKEEGK